MGKAHEEKVNRHPNAYLQHGVNAHETRGAAVHEAVEGEVHEGDTLTSAREQPQYSTV
jgi:hypothetical protein